MNTEIIKVIIVDDEEASLQTLKMKLEMYYPQAEVVCLCNSAKEGIQAISRHDPDLVFLDIEMPWMNGFEMLDCLGDNFNFDVVFVTAYDQYAIKAFKVKAIDYLLKPVDKDDLLNCLNNVQLNQRTFDRVALTDLVEELDKPIIGKRAMLHTKYGIEIISLDQIIYCHADSNYSVVISADDRKIMITKSLSAVEKQFDSSFVRIHRSYTVNLNYIKRFCTVDGYQVELTTGEKLPVSRRKKDNLLYYLGHNLKG